MGIAVIGCRDEPSSAGGVGIDFLNARELMGIPTAEEGFIRYESDVQSIKLGAVVRRAVVFPDGGVIEFKVTGASRGARFVCAVGVETSGGFEPDETFSFTCISESGAQTSLRPTWFSDESRGEWHELEVNLSRHANQDIALRIEVSNENLHGPAYLAHPRLVVPKGSEATRVILICVDTLRADAVGSYGCTRGMTPELDEFAGQSIRFAYCESPSPWTLPSVSATLTSKYAGMIGVDSISERLPEGEITLSEVFLDAGYCTAALGSNRWVSSGVGFFQGYDQLTERSYKVDAYELLNGAFEWIKFHKDEDFFVYIHLFDPHVPYEPPEPYLSTFRRGGGPFVSGFDNATQVWEGQFVLAEEVKEQLRGLYDGEVAWVDAQLGGFFGQLRRLRIWDDTAIVIYSDHGEEFWEHGGYEHGHSVYEELTHVPLMMKLPGMAPGVREERMSLVDVMPTLINWADLEAPDGLVGRDLLSPENDAEGGRMMFIEGCIHTTERRACVEGDWKQILYFGGDGQPELYNLKDDPSESVNLYETEVEVAERLSTELLMYSAGTSEGFHMRLYPLEEVTSVVYELAVSVEDGIFSDIVHEYRGTLINETLQPDRIVSQVLIECAGVEHAEYQRRDFIELGFNVEPEEAPVTIQARILDSPEIEFPWQLGASDMPIEAGEITITMPDSRIAMSYPEAGSHFSYGVYIWSVPPSIRDELENTLSPEALEELRALGYIQ